VLHRDQTDIRFDLAAELIRGRLSEDRPFTAHLEVRNADLAEIETLAGYDYPVSGQLNLTMQASGTVSQPHGEGHLEFTHAVLYGETLEHFTADLRFANQEVELNNIQAAQGTATITGSTAYNLSDSTFHFNLTGGNFDLTRIAQLQSRRFSIAGRMDFTAQGAGTREAPAINARIDLHDLTFDRERAGDFTLQAVTQGTDLTLTGRSHFPEGELAVDGGIHLRDNLPADLTMRFNHLDVDSIIRLYLGGHLTGHSSIAGEVKVNGPLREPRQLNVTANLGQFFADVEGIKLHNDGPIRFNVANEVASLDQLRLVGDLTDFAAHGTMQLAGQRQLNLNADGHINLKLIESFNPDFTSAGRLTLGMSVSGTVSDPVLQGRVEINEAALSYVDVPSGLSNMNGSLLFNQDRLQIESLTARTGGGLLNLGGSASYYRGQLSFDLTAQAQEVRLRYPPGVSSTADADLRLAGTTGSAVLSGDITIVKLALTPGFDFGSYLQRSKQTSAIPNPNSLLNRVQLDIHLTTVPELQMQTALARLSGDADLRMHGTAAHPTVLGRVDIVEGEVSFNRAKYRLERGSVAFTNPVRIEPILDLQLSRHVGDYDITLGLNGTLDKLNINYRSEPPLPSSDVIALLALGRTRTESASLQSESSSFNQETSNLILSEAVNTMVLNRAQSLFGASTSVMIDPNGPSTETSLVSNAPWVTVQRQVVNNLNLTYSTYVAQTSQQVIQLEYKVTNSISIVALRDYNGVVSFDVKLRKRRK
jgi:translocation and assembly module TamB